MPKQVVRRALVAVAALTLMLAFAGVASATNYIVLYKAKGVPADGGAVIRSAGGTVVASYAQIGVIVADSSSTTFSSDLMRDSRVQAVSTTANFAVRIRRHRVRHGPARGRAAERAGDRRRHVQRSAVGHGPDPRAGGARDHRRQPVRPRRRHRHRPRLHAIRTWRRTSTSRNSVSCVGGGADPGPAAWARRQRPRHAHRRHDRRGRERHRHRRRRAERPHRGHQGRQRRRLLLPGGCRLRASCGPATHHFDVTNNSYFADPLLLQLPQRLRRSRPSGRPSRGRSSTRRARVSTIVAAHGQLQADDLAHPTQDIDRARTTRPGEPAGSRTPASSSRPRCRV